MTLGDVDNDVVRLDRLRRVAQLLTGCTRGRGPCQLTIENCSVVVARNPGCCSHSNEWDWEFWDIVTLAFWSK